MRIIEGTAVNGEHVWIVRAVDGKELEVGFRTRTDAVAYRNACLALRQFPSEMARHLEMVRRAQHAVITHG